MNGARKKIAYYGITFRKFTFISSYDFERLASDPCSLHAPTGPAAHSPTQQSLWILGKAAHVLVAIKAVPRAAGFKKGTTGNGVETM